MSKLHELLLNLLQTDQDMDDALVEQVAINLSVWRT